MEKELRYIECDPQKLWEEMQLAYIDAGGDILYPGDEKEMLLRAVQAAIVQKMICADNALKMQTLSFATGKFLDILGERKNCKRILEQRARAEIVIKTKASYSELHIRADSPFTKDENTFYTLEDEINTLSYGQEIRAVLIASLPGESGNALKAGDAIKIVFGNENVEKISVIKDASGGSNYESDDKYRERIRKSLAKSVTTGSAKQYESVASGVSSDIIDVKASQKSTGTVGVYLIIKNDEAAENIIERVKQALSAQDTRPLTDTISVERGTKLNYSLKIKYTIDASKNSELAIGQAVNDYKKQQNFKLGTAFNPQSLVAGLYRAGASKVEMLSGSTFNSTTAEYAKLKANEYVDGEIALTVVKE